MKNLYIVCYDISNDRTRYRIEKIISNFGHRVQYSVFECILSNDDNRKMIRVLKEAFVNLKIDKSFDSVRIYRLCDSCRPKVVKIGIDKSVREDYQII
jgi:CRISPR-associated protein Cas2